MTTDSTHASIAAQDIITSATPLEGPLLGVHPRLMCIRHPFPKLQRRLTTEPWQSWLQQLESQSQPLLTIDLPQDLYNTPSSIFDARDVGRHLISLSLLYTLTRQQKYFDRIAYLLDRLSQEHTWGDSLIYGHWAKGFALTLDWLWHDFDQSIRQKYVQTLYHHARHVFDKWTSFRAGEPFGYTWNISAVVLGGLTATAACIYAEHPNVAPLANLAIEKMHAQSAALGPDGVSPEGIMYGGYYSSFLTFNFFIAKELFALDFFANTPWFSRYASSLHAQSLPRKNWHQHDAFFNQGDAHGNPFGIESVLRVIASANHDPGAQWLAEDLFSTGHAGVNPFTLILHNPHLTAASLLPRPFFTLMEDHGIAVMRSGWSGSESVAVFKCAPNVGHHAAKRYNNPLAGGHMYPNNGDLQLFSHGQWILPGPGYVYKTTAFHNTILINNAGQYGENSAWFEDLPYRISRAYPSLIHNHHHPHWDYSLADLTHAYPVETGLQRLYRHILYLRPHTWLIIDAAQGTGPITPTILFHTAMPLTQSGPNTFTGAGPSAALFLQTHSPASLTATTEDQILIHTSGHPNGTLPLLRISPVTPSIRHLLVTLLQTHPAGTPPPISPDIQISQDQDTLQITTPDKSLTITLHPFTPSPPAAHITPNQNP